MAKRSGKIFMCLNKSEICRLVIMLQNLWTFWSVPCNLVRKYHSPKLEKINLLVAGGFLHSKVLSTHFLAFYISFYQNISVSKIFYFRFEPDWNGVSDFLICIEQHMGNITIWILKGLRPVKTDTHYLPPQMVILLIYFTTSKITKPHDNV